MTQLQNLPPPLSSSAESSVLTSLDDRLAEAARYAVLNRLMPFLRHDVAGAIQPVRMLFMVLEKRLQASEPDLQAIAKNVTSASTLSKQAGINCLGALGWLSSNDDMQVSLRSFVEEANALLAIELGNQGLTLANDIEDTSTTTSLTFLRTVLMGALLAMCDQQVEAGVLQITFKPDFENSLSAGLVHLHKVADAANTSARLQDVVRKYRMIGWPDVQAMARSCGMQMTLGEDRVTLALPPKSWTH